MKKYVGTIVFFFLLAEMLFIAPPQFVHADTTEIALQGVALKDKINVYAQTDTDAAVVKAYQQGDILKLRKWTPDWFTAIVYVGGKKKQGFIQNVDVDPLVQQHTMHGYAQDYVSVYATPSNKAELLKTYPIASKLTYKTFSTNWHMVTVYVKGKAKTGYLQADTIGNTKPEITTYGYAAAIPTNIYPRPVAGYNVPLKAYPKGTVLKYRLYTPDWYEATVYINGKQRIGYIDKRDIADEAATGYAAKKKTSVYSSTSRKAAKLKDYSIGKKVKYRVYNQKWLQATIYINGKATNGYFSVDDVVAEKPDAAKSAAERKADAFENKVVALTNKERKKYDLKPLRMDKDLNQVARIKSEDMRQRHYFDHTSPTYGSLAQFYDSLLVRGYTYGENIAKGYVSPEDVVQAWMNSPGHRENILNRNYTHIGVGYVEKGHYWTEEFVQRLR
ncbi:CAP domain-containing protein [Virgibacillus sp. 179-BFC.A HS]|uniref:CAP domain-containing protein n=1 Tax=Tigheibacillus jepli TaxID=3035914 RepID=A0ABU5CE52_9BACI|nr:CAP domain-containing protein [Virgibacillus sp. 179-BFC.A HS]MDY0404612.1 CAP domain-containing protein [Virgibacillus sp. 179-BFC.A HS]